MRIAIVGAGVSGLVAAHLLHERHEIVRVRGGARARAATRTRSGSTPRTRRTGSTPASSSSTTATTRASSACSTASASRRQPADDELRRHRRGGRASSTRAPRRTACSPRAAHLVSPRFHRMLADVRPLPARGARAARVRRRATRRSPSGSSAGGFSRAFVERLIVPQAAAVWSADPRQMWSFPARFLAEFFDNHGMLELRGRPQWRTVTRRLAPVRRGARRAVPRPAAPRDAGARDPPPSRPRHGRRRAAASPSASTRSSSPRTPTRRSSCSPTRRRASTRSSARSRTSANEAVLHTDRRLLPRRRRAWASWNYHLLDAPAGPPDRDLPHEPPAVARRGRASCCVTLNRTEAIDPAKVIAHDRLRAPGLHVARASRPSAATARSAAAGARTSAARTGAGASTRTASRARCASPRALGGRSL